MFPLILVASAVGLGLFWHFRRSEGRAQNEPLKKPIRNFASVELRRGRGACRAARKLASQPILAIEAPVLPLPVCSAAVCRCRYHKIEDRRDDDVGRRMSDHGVEPVIFDGVEQRATSIDRRSR